jgi:hypothetical protein
VGGKLRSQQSCIGSGEKDFVPFIVNTAYEPFPAVDILDLVEENDPDSRENFLEDHHEAGEVGQSEIDQPFVIEIDIIKIGKPTRKLPHER